MKTKVVILTGILLLATAPLFAAYDAFLKIDTIQGESTSHPGWMDISSFSWGANSPTAPATTNLPAVQKCSIHSLNFTKRIDKASPILARMAMTGTPIPNVIFEEGGQRHMLQNVAIIAIKTQNLGDGSVEVVSLNFTRCATHDAAPTAIDQKYLKIDGRASAALKIDMNGTIAFGSGGGAGEPIALQDFHFVGQNQAMLACRKAGGGQEGILIGLLRASQSKQKLPSLTIQAKQKGQQQYYKVTLNEVFVSSYQQAGPGGFDQVTLNFTRADGGMAPFHDISIK